MKNNSQEVYKGQRGKEKRELFQRFKIRAIEDIYKKKFFNLFDNQCFKCGIKERPFVDIGPPVLCIDHHIPMILGGHLVPGNLVSLCRSCNNKKHDSLPEEFYTQKKLDSLKPILEKQHEVFNFNFDWKYWDKDREGYLLSLGVDSKLVHELFYNPEHRDYIGLPSDNSCTIIKIDINDILNGIFKS
ncbi:MAG: HNH endonuclease [Ignavibacteriaceae bacterium]|nr:HNH endonuclease [Ignavibacteriaceae bacterium]